MLKKIKIASRLRSSNAYHTGKGRSKENSNIVYGFCLVKGKSKHLMEDYHHAEFKRINRLDLGFFAIYDGHLSHTVPHYLQNHLFQTIISQSEFSTNPIDAIRKAYELTDNVILQKSADLGVGGSTAVTAILMNGRRLLVANVGDSRAVLCRGGNAIQLSMDHEPESEKMHIESRGGFVSVLPGDVPRVDGQLAVARAFGDKNLKEHLSAEPHIDDRWLDQTDEFVILASDGLWKVIENQDAVNLISKVKNPESAAKMLVEAALERNSKDDISCIVIRFK